MSNLDSLKSLPLIDRIIITVDTLARFHRINADKGAALGLTRKLQDQACFDKGKASAYKDTLVFITRLFEAEIREKMQPKGGENVENIPTESGAEVQQSDSGAP